jgi:hypothetical protein
MTAALWVVAVFCIEAPLLAPPGAPPHEPALRASIERAASSVTLHAPPTPTVKEGTPWVRVWASCDQPTGCDLGERPAVAYGREGGPPVEEQCLALIAQPDVLVLRLMRGNHLVAEWYRTTLDEPNKKPHVVTSDFERER